jgi:hypothetical protein
MVHIRWLDLDIIPKDEKGVYIINFLIEMVL